MSAARFGKFLAENSVTILLIVCGVVFIVSSGRLPAPRFDPLGAGAFPIALGWLIVALATAELARAFWIHSRRAGAEGERGTNRGLIRAGGVFGMTLLYALSMAAFQVWFAIATTTYLAVMTMQLWRMSLRRGVPLLVLLTAFAFALDYLLKNVVYVDLP